MEKMNVYLKLPIGTNVFKSHPDGLKIQPST